MLDREEEEYKRVVREKYKYLAQKLQEAMDQVKPVTARSEEQESEVP